MEDAEPSMEGILGPPQAAGSGEEDRRREAAHTRGLHPADAREFREEIMAAREARAGAAHWMGWRGFPLAFKDEVSHHGRLSRLAPEPRFGAVAARRKRGTPRRLLARFTITRWPSRSGK
jgi:hypothetical protein